mgnify:CR=1 FL=1
MKTTVLKLSQVIDGGICVAASDGQKVYARLSRELDAGNRVVLSFDGVTRMTTAFLNAAVGQAYGEYSEQQIKNQLGAPVDYEEWHIKRLRMVTKRAKNFFINKEEATKMISEESDE